MTVQEINAAIMALTDPKDLRSVYQAYAFAQKQVNASVKYSFQIGDKVTFFARNQRWTGQVVKRNNKTIKVVTSSPRTMSWRVSPTFLEKVSP